MKRMTDKQRNELKKLKALERECQRDRKKFFAEIDDNVDDVVHYLEDKGYTILSPDAVGNKTDADSEKSDDSEDGGRDLFSLLDEDDDGDQDDGDSSSEPFHYFRSGGAD